MEPTEAQLIAAVLRGDTASFEPLVRKYSPELFGMARHYARRESEVEDIVQDIWMKAAQRLGSYRGDAPFEHWLKRLAIHTCYDYLRRHQRNRSTLFSDLTDPEWEWLEELASAEGDANEQSDAARQLVQRILEQLPPQARLVITLLEIEDRTIKEICRLTGWTAAMVKVRAFRARAQMRQILAQIAKDKYL